MANPVRREKPCPARYVTPPLTRHDSSSEDVHVAGGMIPLKLKTPPELKGSCGMVTQTLLVACALKEMTRLFRYQPKGSRGCQILFHLPLELQLHTRRGGILP